MKLSYSAFLCFYHLTRVKDFEVFKSKIRPSVCLFRYRAIVKPLDRKHSSSPTSIALQAALIWLFSLLLAIPEAVFSDLHTFNVTSTNESFVTCAPYPHAGELHPKIHSMAFFLIFYMIPLLVISVYYVFIAKNLMRSALNMPVEDNTYARQQVSSFYN